MKCETMIIPLYYASIISSITAMFTTGRRALTQQHLCCLGLFWEGNKRRYNIHSWISKPHIRWGMFQMCAVLTPSTRTSCVLPIRAALTLAASSLNTLMHSASLCCFTSAGTSSCSRWEAWVFWAKETTRGVCKKNWLFMAWYITNSPFSCCRQTGSPHCSPPLWSETESAGGRPLFRHRSLRWSRCWDSPLTHRHVIISVKHTHYTSR